MASIESRDTPKGKRRYYVRYRDATGKQRSRSFGRKTDAQSFLATTVADMARGDWLDPDRARETVGSWAPRWLVSKDALASSNRDRGLIENHVLPRWGDTALADVAYHDVDAWLHDLRATGLSASSLRKTRGALSGVLTMAMRSGAIRSNPVAGIKIESDDRHEMGFLRIPEIETLADIITYPGMVGLNPSRPFDGIRPDLGAMVRFAAGTGLRRSEILRLERSHIDLEGRGVRILKSKSAAGRRRVPIAPRLEPMIAEQLDRSKGSRYMFPSSTGGPIDGNGLYKRHYVPATIRAGLAPLRFHDLRHTFAALMIQAEAKPLSLMRWMGHSSIKVTFDIYGHLFTDYDEDVMNRF